MTSHFLTGATFPTLKGDADSLLFHKGTVQRVGRYRDVKGDAPADTRTIDLSGSSVLPGLGDAHVHFAATGFLQTAIDGSQVGNVRDLLKRIHQETQRRASGGLILGLRLSDTSLVEGRLPTLAELDAAAPHHPVYLRHITGHASLANSLALSSLGFTPGQAGVALSESGGPTGYLTAQATQLATQKMYALNAEGVGYENAFCAAAERAVQQGCTVVHALDDLEAVRALQKVEAKLPVRVMPYTQSFDLDGVRQLGLPRIGGCHGCALDGDFDMHTAALLEPYEGTLDDYGVLYHNALTLEGFVLEAHRRGLQVAFHAVGDRAVEQALCAFEKAQREHPRPDPRHRIEHAQLISERQIERVRALGVVVSLQPAFNHIWDHHTYPPYVGERAAHIDPLATLARSGIPLAGGSDSTVTELAPLKGIHAAVNHSRPEERLSVREAIELFSHGVAYSTFHERERGRIAEGFAADLTVLGENPLETDPARIKDIPVVMTVIKGEVVFEA